MTVLDAMADEQLFGRWFRAPSWRRWMVFLAAIHGLPREALAPFDVSPDEALDRFVEHTGRSQWPTGPCEQPVVIKGRRAGFSRLMTADAVYRATCRDHALVSGERGVYMLLGADLRQAHILHRYARTYLREIPLLVPLLVRETTDILELSNGVTIEARPSSFRTVRGVTLIGAVVDELAFMGVEDAALSDAELLTALKPALATTGGPLICGSSPHAKKGELWRLFRAYWSRDDAPDVLIWRATSQQMNPTLPDRLVARALADDEAAARAEWLGEFRDDVVNLLDREVIESLVEAGVTQRPYASARRYFAHVDPSGGRGDAMTVCVCHREGDRVLVDYLGERKPPFDPHQVTDDFARALIDGYGLRSCQVDAYGAQWVTSAFAAAGVTTRQAERTTSEHFLELVPMVVSGRLTLLDEPRLVTQLANLERRVTRGGREQVGHPSGQHDDLAAALAGAVAQAARPPRTTVGWVNSNDLCPWLHL